MSSTLMRITVPVLCGVLPSAAVRIKLNSVFSPRSSCFSSTSSAYLLPSRWVCTSRRKCSLELIV
uniref:Secreted protein n=1 Tax=Chrysemys picta bellii TaxID=8478 RepID=A0A8C3FKM2_CHRPI